MARAWMWLMAAVIGLASAVDDKTEFSLQERAEAMEKLVSSPMHPVYFSVYVFNILNPEEIRLNVGKPELEEIGPFVYRRHLVKTNKVDLGDGKLQYMLYSKFVFQPDLSNGLTEDMVITTLNAPLVGSAMMHPIILKLLQMHREWLETETVFSNYTVGDLLFQSFHSEILKKMGNYTKQHPDLIDAIGLDIPPYLTEGVFSYFYGKNDTLDGPYVVHDGSKDKDKFSEFISYRGRDHLELWKNPYCNRINGTDGFQYPPGVKKDDVIALFTPDICRSVYSKFASVGQIQDVEVYRFELAEESIEMSQDNECFCKDNHGSKETCYGSGTWNMGTCQYNTPVVMSPPHFYNADPKLLEAIDGLSPSREKHLTFQDVEPLSGATLRAHKRFQINFKINPIEIADMHELQDVVLPILWMDEHLSVEQESAEKIRDI